MPNADERPLPAILKRLLLFMEQQGLSAYQVNKEAGLAKGLITNAINKRLGLTSGTLEALLNAYPQLNANWLIVGRGPMLNEEPAPENSKESKQAASTQHRDDLQQIQDQCIGLVRLVQQMKQRADDQLLEELIGK